MEQRKGSERTFRLVIDQLDRGWSTRSFPHLIDPRQLYVADNVVFEQDGLVSKRPGSIFYGGGTSTGATGSGSPVISGTRFYRPGSAPQLVVQSGGSIYTGNDATGAFTAIGSGFSANQPATFAQVYDPDMTTGAAVALVICDGSRIPYLWDGTHLTPVQTGTPFLPNNPITSSVIHPKYVANWKYHLVYAGDANDPTGVYIGDALRPERFTGTSLTDSTGANFLPYYPAGRGADAGVVTGIDVVGQYLVVFYTSAVVVGYNTGTYGAFEFEWVVLSNQVGCVSPRSIVAFGGYLAFFGGDRFYATDGSTVVPLPDEIPSVYGNSAKSTFPAEMLDKTTVCGARRGLQYLASYDNIGAGKQSAIACFDIGAAGGWQYGSPKGGAWSRFPTGMPMAFGIEGRGPGEANFPFFWGRSDADVVGEWDTGTYDDFGQPIAIEIRCKGFFLDRPTAQKRVKYIDVVAAFPITFKSPSGSYEVVADVYTSTGRFFLSSNQPTTFQVETGFVFYDSSNLMDSSVDYGAGSNIGILTLIQRAWIPPDALGPLVQPGLIEASSNPFNVIAFVAEIEIHEPVK